MSAPLLFADSGPIIALARLALLGPRSQLAVSTTARETHQAVEDWRYWVAMCYAF